MESALYDPARHEPLQSGAWDEETAMRTIERIVRDTEQRYVPGVGWPTHPLDADDGNRVPVFDLYSGAAGVVWALHHLRAAGTVELTRAYEGCADELLRKQRAMHGNNHESAAAYLAGDTGILLLDYWLRPGAATADRLEQLIGANLDHPARELMWGAPGTMLAALFLHERSGEARWRDLYLASARKLWSQLEWSPECQCSYWTQQLGRHRVSSLGGVHGFVATAAPLIRGRGLMEPREWDAWERCIVETVQRSATREGDRANWRPDLYPYPGDARPQKKLLQFCHGAPGFVICLAGLPSRDLDDLLVAAGEAIWTAGPLRKGSNLCHGTGGNGLALLKLCERTGDLRWLARARAFAMHGIGQTDAHARRYGQLRYSLWTGDPGLAIFLRDCHRGAGRFPTVEGFFD